MIKKIKTLDKDDSKLSSYLNQEETTEDIKAEIESEDIESIDFSFY